MAEQTFIEGTKLFYDAFKHLTTLNTGSILLLATFLEKVFQKPVAREYFAIALGAFILSVLFSFIVMLFLSKDMGQSGEASTPFSYGYLACFFIALVAFGIANASLAVFAYKNLQQLST